MTENFKVSIIVPVHNAAGTIDRCIKSIIQQSYDNIECILIENGSEDSSLKICQAYAERFSFIKVFNSKKGASAARNLGLSMASGKIIGFCDADDFMEEDAISTVVSTFIDNPDIIGVFSAFYVLEERGCTKNKEYRGIDKSCLQVKDAIKLILGNNNIMGTLWNKFYIADVLKGAYLDESLSFSEDLHFNLKILTQANADARIMYISEPLYYYVMNENSITHNTDLLFDDKDNLKYIVAMYKIIDDCVLSKQILSIIKMKITMVAIEYAYKPSISMKQRKKLLCEINSNWKYFLFNFFKFDIKKNIKLLVKLTIAICRVGGRSGG